MTSEAVEGRLKRGDEFWRDFHTMSDYFSPAIAPLQRYLGVGSKEMMFSLGVSMGEKAAERLAHLNTREMLSELSSVWEKYGIGMLIVEETDPLAILISDCRICGQLPGTGQMYECAFHEGFLQGALSGKLGKGAGFHQETNYEGEAGTWCRRLVANTRV